MSHKTHHYSDGKVVSQNVKENADTIASSLVNDSFYGTVVSNDFNQTKQAVSLAIVLCSMFLIVLGFLFFKYNLFAFAFFCIGVLAWVERPYKSALLNKTEIDCAQTDAEGCRMMIVS